MKNYLVDEGGITVRLVGFDEIGNFLFVSIPVSKRTLIIESHSLPEKENCFRVDVSPERTVQNRRFYELVDDFQLFQKSFIYNSPLGNYFCM